MITLTSLADRADVFYIKQNLKKQVRGTNKMRMTIHEYIWVSLGLFLVSMVLFGTPSLLTQDYFGSRLVSLGSLGLLGSDLNQYGI